MEQYVSTEEDLKKEIINFFAQKGWIDNPQTWMKKIDEPMPVWAVFQIYKNMYEDKQQ